MNFIYFVAKPLILLWTSEASGKNTFPPNH